MKYGKRCLTSLIAAGTLLSLVGAAPAPKASYAMVDLFEVIGECKQTKAAETTAESKRRMYGDLMQKWDDRPLMSEDEFKQALDLSRKPKPTDQDKAALQKLWDEGSKRNSQQANLFAKGNNLTDAEKKQLQDWISLSQQNKQKLNQYQQQFMTELTNERNKNADDIIKLAKQTMNETAKKKSCLLVFDSRVALYSDNNITQSVLDEMNKKK